MLLTLTNANETKQFKTTKELLLLMLNEQGDDCISLSVAIDLQLQFEEIAGNTEATIVFKTDYEKFVNLLKKKIN